MDFYSIPGIPEPQPDIGSWRTFSFLPQFSLDLVAFDCFLFRYSHLLLSHSSALLLSPFAIGNLHN
jgi:hypothetical protein